jgi:glycosyltransferase involved in cell wall biosynthesis
MKIKLQEYRTKNNEIILYKGNPDFEKLEELSLEIGDIWHSSFEQGYKNAFMDIKYQAATYFWYVKDFDVDHCVSWRINPHQFAVRKTIWEEMGGFDQEYENPVLQALDFGYNALRVRGAIPLYHKGLFSSKEFVNVELTKKERYVFFRKNFKQEHSVYMLFRKGFWNFSELSSYLYAKKKHKKSPNKPIIKFKELKPIVGNPAVSFIIPTMLRQDFTLNLLDDLKNQTFLPSEVIIVDATPEAKRDENLYNPAHYPFKLIVKWQQTKGSCRARNEAIELCTGDYIIFGDDDIRFENDYIENHIRFLQTNKANASIGIDIAADHQKQDLNDLKQKLQNYGNNRYYAGITDTFNNANSCVSKKYVDLLIGNDINFDGGYGEDNDFGFSLAKSGLVVIKNPFAATLHLKPPVGGYRFWGNQSKILGKKRKKQPWELDTPVKWIRPVPSPTIMYYIYKHYSDDLITEYKIKYFLFFLFKGPMIKFPLRLLNFPNRLIQYNKSVFYAKKLVKLGKRTQ